MGAAGESMDEHHGSATFEDEQGENYKVMTNYWIPWAASNDGQRMVHERMISSTCKIQGMWVIFNTVQVAPHSLYPFFFFWIAISNQQLLGRIRMISSAWQNDQQHTQDA